MRITLLCIRVNKLNIKRWDQQKYMYLVIKGFCYTKDSRYNKLLGPSEITLLYQNFCYIRVAKTIKYKDILNFGTKKITLLYRDFVISVFFVSGLFIMRFQCTVEPLYSEVLGTMKITLLYQVSHYIRVKKQRNIKSWDQQIYLGIRGFCYIRPRYNEVPLY